MTNFLCILSFQKNKAPSAEKFPLTEPVFNKRRRSKSVLPLFVIIFIFDFDYIRLLIFGYSDRDKNNGKIQYALNYKRNAEHI